MLEQNNTVSSKRQNNYTCDIKKTMSSLSPLQTTGLGNIKQAFPG